MSATDDALDVVRLCWPEHEWESCPAGLPCVRRRTGALLERDRYVYWRPTNHDHIAAAERVLVEQGLGEEYGHELYTELAPPGEMYRWPVAQKMAEWVARIATAPLDARLRALARVVRENQKPKETEA